MLVVDDSPDDLALFGRVLAQSQVEAELLTFRDGEEAIEFLDCLTRSPLSLGDAVVFCDIRMPKCTGLEVVEWIRTQPKLDGLTIFMLTSSDEPVDWEQAARCGASGFVAKFPSPGQLRTLITDPENATQHFQRRD